MNNPNVPLVTDRHTVAVTRNTSPIAIVASIKKGPRSLKQVNPIINAKMIDNRIPPKMPINGGIELLRNSNVDVYAPIPKNAPCPRDNCPVKPPRIFHAVAHVALSKIKIIIF